MPTAIRTFALLLALLPVLTATAQSPAPQPAWLQNVRALAIAQLDAELRHAHARHAADGRPLPEPVKQLMRGLVPDDLLEAARFTVSVDAPTLPALLNRGNRELLGQDHAVSLPDLIVFSREPTLQHAADARWWGHELAHLLQYRQWGGTAAFAQRYVDDFQAVEREAEILGRQARQRFLAGSRDTPEAATIAAPVTAAIP
jgi:hypothetical protein